MRQIRNKWIAQQIEKDREAQKDVIKLLFLGAGECGALVWEPTRSLRGRAFRAGEAGKSTLLKQMNLIHGNGFTPEDRKTYIGLCRVRCVV